MNPSGPDHQPQIYSVSQLNRETRKLLAEHFLTVRVEGEISNLSTPSSGHIYFSLKDDKAQVRCAMFRMQQRTLKFKPENGKQVMVSARVSLYEPRGDYQLIVEQMEVAGEGALRQVFEKLKQKLLAEGLFDVTRKQKVPDLPATVGVITSSTGAAIHDILTVLNRRFPAVPIVIYPVSVQGDVAKTEIVKAIKTANRQHIAEVLIIARGGGTLEDLWAFNEETVARAIAASKIPVISGIGHEVDVTICDYVADLRAPTPSAAAEYAVPDQQEWLNTFCAYENQFQQLIQRKLQQQIQILSWLGRSLHQQHPGQKLQRNAQHLDELEKRLMKNWHHRLIQFKNTLEVNGNSISFYNPTEKISRHRQQLRFIYQRLNQSMTLKLDQSKRRMMAASQTLHAVSPLATLDRGYAIATKHPSKQIIQSVKQLTVGDLTETRLSHGRFISQVKKIIEKQ